MTALVTGASSGIGREIARELAKRGMRLIISGRNREALEELRKEIGEKKVKIIVADLTKKEACCRLYEQSREYDVDILVNNAGFGTFGKFNETDLETELDMINVNITAVHILTKLFLKDFTAADKGYILNVASSAGFMPGPYMATYYATKGYVVSLTEAINSELKRDNSKVYIGALCPGPVNTNFNNTAGVSFGIGGISAEYAAEYTIKKMFMRKTIIIPTLKIKAAVYGSRLVPISVAADAAGNMQKLKGRLQEETPAGNVTSD